MQSSAKSLKLKKVLCFDQSGCLLERRGGAEADLLKYRQVPRYRRQARREIPSFFILDWSVPRFTPVQPLSRGALRVLVLAGTLGMISGRSLALRPRRAKQAPPWAWLRVRTPHGSGSREPRTGNQRGEFRCMKFIVSRRGAFPRYAPLPSMRPAARATRDERTGSLGTKGSASIAHAQCRPPLIAARVQSTLKKSPTHGRPRAGSAVDQLLPERTSSGRRPAMGPGS